MTTYRPCIGCIARANCEIKKGVAAALRGQPVTQAKIKCSLPFTRDFPPGTRVTVMVWDHNDFDGHAGETPAKMVPATVVGPSSKKAGKLLTHLDEPVQIGYVEPGSSPKMTEFRAAWPKDVVKLDEPARPSCSSCNRAYVHDKCSCSGQDGYAGI